MRVAAEDRREFLRPKAGAKARTGVDMHDGFMTSDATSTAMWTLRRISLPRQMPFAAPFRSLLDIRIEPSSLILARLRRERLD